MFGVCLFFSHFLIITRSKDFLEELGEKGNILHGI